MHLKSPISYTVVVDMTMSGKNVKLTVTVVVKKTLSRSLGCTAVLKQEQFIKAANGNPRNDQSD